MQSRLLRMSLVLLAMFASLLISGCNPFKSSQTMRVLAGSELKDIEPLLPEIERKTGVRLELDYIGTLDGAEQLLSGGDEDYDLAWFSHARYLNLLQGGRGVIETEEKIMLSPVVLGVKESKARKLGWVDNEELTWRDIANEASAGNLRYAMTNPASSNSGFTALMGVAAALSGSSDALQAGDVDAEGLQAFFQGQALTAGSSGWLADSYVESQDTLDGMINYESVLLALNEGSYLREPLILIYPQEGIITADYPLMLLNGEMRDEYDELVAFLRTPEFQERLMETTLRRPAAPGVRLDPRIPDELLVELPFPNTVAVIEALLFSYLDEHRIPAHAFFVLDVSGSMEGEGLRDLKFAITNLTGVDDSLTGRFARFRNRERITVIPFRDYPETYVDFEISETEADSEDMQRIRDYVNGLNADGGTAIYSTLAEAYRLAAESQHDDPGRYYSIVLMSDGDNTAGIKLRKFREYYNSLSPEVQAIRTFAILFGDADEEAMHEISELTGGRVFDGTSESLSSIFKTIRGYQ